MISYQTNIIKKFLSDSEFKKFHDEYKAHLHIAQRNRMVTQKDKMILIEWKKGSSISELARKHRCSISSVKTSIVLASRG